MVVLKRTCAMLHAVRKRPFREKFWGFYFRRKFVGVHHQRLGSSAMNLNLRVRVCVYIIFIFARSARYMLYTQYTGIPT